MPLPFHGARLPHNSSKSSLFLLFSGGARPRTTCMMMALCSARAPLSPNSESTTSPYDCFFSRHDHLRTNRKSGAGWEDEAGKCGGRTPRNANEAHALQC